LMLTFVLIIKRKQNYDYVFQTNEKGSKHVNLFTHKLHRVVSLVS